MQRNSTGKTPPSRTPAGKTQANHLLGQTNELVMRLIRENRALKARNLKLNQQLELLGKGWEQIRKLASAAPRRRRG